MDYAKKLNRRFRDFAWGTCTFQKERGMPVVGWYSSGRVEEEEGTQMFLCGNPEESRNHIPGVEECELYKEERNALREDGGKCAIVTWGSLAH